VAPLCGSMAPGNLGWPVDARSNPTLKLRHQILILAIVPLILAVSAITALVIWQSTSLAETSIEAFESNMLKAKETELLNLTNLAISAIDEVYRNAGPDDEAAKDQVRSILTSLDYGEDGYFFVYDYNGNNIVHPRQTYRPGQNWLDLVDPDGDHVIANLIERAKEGGGLHQYKWEKPSQGVMADKLSFAVGLDKWRWMLGTGVYLDDVFAQTAVAKAELRDSIGRTFLIVMLIAVPSVLIVFATCMALNARERHMADSKLKQLTQRIVHTQEEERSRIARELHDGISQNLVGVRYAIDLARRKVTDGTPEAIGAIERGAAALNGAIKEVRRLSHDLRPRVLDDLGLAPALEALCHNFSERTGIITKLDCIDYASRPRIEPSTALYRVAQEALNNVERHSQASAVTITLSSPKGRITMVITDNGKGFAPPGKNAQPGGLGLRNMQERMAHFGGLLLIQSTPGETTLKAMLPRSASLAQSNLAEVA